MNTRTDEFHDLFPGDGLEQPTPAEWDRAEEFCRSWNIPGNLNRNNPNRMSTFSPWWANRAHLRAQLRRRWTKEYR